jgi:hypothetical protein
MRSRGGKRRLATGGGIGMRGEFDSASSLEPKNQY